MYELDMAEAGADLRNGAPPTAHTHQHPFTRADGSAGGGVHTHDHEHVGGGQGEYGNVKLSNDFGSMDWSGLNATSAEIGQVLDAVGEADEEMWAEEQALDTWAASLTDDEIAQLEHEAALDGYGSGPELAYGMDGDGAGGYLDMTAGDIDAALAAMTDREAVRQRQDAAERGGRRGSAEIRLASAMGRLQAGTYLYGQAPADFARDPQIDDLFSTGPLAGPADVREQMLYQLAGGARPRARGRQPMPPVQGLAARIGLR